jgi:2-(1,2-epoxy-1,2-dihydrophenyl)acetyl-CoA isomerase
MGEWEVSSESEILRLSRQGEALRIELNRPQALNALSRELDEELLETFKTVGADDSIRAVMITGAGRAFSAGADISGPRADDRRAATRSILEDVVNPMILALREMPKPVVAAVNGPCAGVGCSMAIASDVVLAAESAYFLLAFSNIGLCPDGGATLTVAARVGAGRAGVLALLAERLPAAQAVDWGLADQLVADEDLEQAATDLTVRLAAGPTRSYAAIKQAINHGSLAGLADQMALETKLQEDLSVSADHAEGVAAFAEKRKPKFVGFQTADTGRS